VCRVHSMDWWKRRRDPRARLQGNIRQGGQGTLQHNDDTNMRILGLTREERAEALGEDAAERRTGVFTSAIVSITEAVKIACSSPVRAMRERT